MSESPDRKALRMCMRMSIEHALNPGYGWGPFVAEHVEPALAKPDPAEALADALKRLRSEVGSMLGTVAAEMRQAAGNTNVAVLELRYNEANAALRAYEESKR